MKGEGRGEGEEGVSGRVAEWARDQKVSEGKCHEGKGEMTKNERKRKS